MEQVARRMVEALGRDAVISEREQLRTYECDGLTSYRVIPGLVVFPQTAENVQAAVRICYEENVPFVARGSGTGLSGGALPVETGVLIVLSRMRKILEVDMANARVVVEPGVINLWVTEAVAPYGYYYAPDPSSQVICSIGGNVAENSGALTVSSTALPPTTSPGSRSSSPMVRSRIWVARRRIRRATT